MKIADAILWPGTKVCEWIGVDPTADAGLIRSMFNMIFYIVVILGGFWVYYGLVS
ncbi:hypothetical protein [Pseudorhodobacter sp.]|uniref:hypothetical protein n=1 Tax=Pseudorhodobacter sp. TaxID=1934400 RepID=UPI00264870F2|nr:hypothetical protein [Pseudorhodobacter sp.]MDN5788863.1 hypothetical protein [Pseudorhodobacter sp.]